MRLIYFGVACALALAIAVIGAVVYFPGNEAARPPLELPAEAVPPLGAIAPVLPAPILPAPVEALPAWKKFAALAPADTGAPLIALVIDDVGQSFERAMEVVALEPPLALALLPYADRLPELAKAARERGHEVLAHLPMQPDNGAIDEGPNGLRLDLDAAELQRRLVWNLDRIEGLVGASNHMGSRFSADAQGMRMVLGEVRARGLLWLDSRTTAASVGVSVAEELNLPAASRDMFLDNRLDAASIAERLRETEAIARANGYAIAIGHPHHVTLQAIRVWQSEVRQRGFQIAPLSAVVARRSSQAPARNPG